MAQTSDGAMKSAAKNAGLSVEEFGDRIVSGLKRCTKCKSWKEVGEFGSDRSRHDGLSAKCFACKRVVERVVTKGRNSPFKGAKHSDETRRKMSEAAKAHPSNRTGKRHTIETRAKISVKTRERAVRGPGAPGYVDGRSAERRGMRASAEMQRWRYDVFLRDEFSCAHCGDDQGGNLNAHHILPFATHPGHRVDVRNGITLCVGCHRLAHVVQLWGYPQPAA